MQNAGGKNIVAKSNLGIPVFHDGSINYNSTGNLMMKNVYSLNAILDDYSDDLFEKNRQVVLLSLIFDHLVALYFVKSLF